MQLAWNLYYWRWIIEDGEPDLQVGEIFEWFAVSFWTPKGLTRSEKRAKLAIGVADYKYRVIAELVYLSELLHLSD